MNKIKTERGYPTVEDFAQRVATLASETGVHGHVYLEIWSNQNRDWKSMSDEDVLKTIFTQKSMRIAVYGSPTFGGEAADKFVKEIRLL